MLHYLLLHLDSFLRFTDMKLALGAVFLANCIPQTPCGLLLFDALAARIEFIFQTMVAGGFFHPQERFLKIIIVEGRAFFKSAAST